MSESVSGIRDQRPQESRQHLTIQISLFNKDVFNKDVELDKDIGSFQGKNLVSISQ